ncbi:MAG: DUF357 domain-containing protein [Methanothrix sp.]|jgi:hypothetical protein
MQEHQDSMSLEVNLAAETRKWLVKAEDLFANISGEEHFLENISAYIRDSHYFLENGDLIRAFEAVIWAWAWMEIGLEREILVKNSQEDAGNSREPA